MKKTVKFADNGYYDTPCYATSGSAGLDIYASNISPIMIPPGERSLIPTGLRMELPEGIQGEIRPRSGLVLKHGVTVLNSPGTLDSDYRGDIGVILYNSGKIPFYVNRGDRIAQMVFMPYVKVKLKEAIKLGATDRGHGGFGSTGK
jgi:dUTP pyrophosphatase